MTSNVSLNYFVLINIIYRLPFPQIKVFIIGCFIFTSLDAISQIVDSTKPNTIYPQTQDSAKIPVSTPKIHSPKKATIMSALLPGLGQIYNKKIWKLPIFYIGFGLVGYSVDFSNRNYHDFKDAYIYRLDNNAGTIDKYDPQLINGEEKYSDEQLLQLKDYYRRNRDLSIIIGTGIYLINIIDAAVDAHFFSYDISKDLSFNITPIQIHGINQPCISSGGTFTLKL